MTCRCETCGQATPAALGLIIDPEARRITRGDRSVTVTPMQARVVERLAQRPGAYVTRVQIFDHLYGLKPDCDHPETDIKMADVFLCKVRPKLRELGIRTGTAFGTGYRLEEIPAANVTPSQVAP